MVEKGDSSDKIVQSCNDEHGHHHHNGHHHHHHHHHHHSDTIAVAFMLNFVFTVIEIIGGYITGSFAILADAIHDLGDTATIGIAWLLEKKSKKSADNHYSYGYARYSLLASVITATFLLVGAIFIIYASIPRLFEPTEPKTLGVIGLAALGVIVNGYAYFKLKAEGSHNEKMLKLHLFEDAAGWIVVLIGAIVMHFTGWYVIDPVLAIILAIYIGYNVLKNLFEVVRIFLQKMPSEYKRDTFAQAIGKVAGVKDVHDIHAWSLDHQKIILTCHVVLDSGANAILAKTQIRSTLSRMGDIHATIEIEDETENCNQDC